MTVRTVTDEELGTFARKQHDWFERVRKGSLDPTLVERAVQDVIDIAPRGTYADEERKSTYTYPKEYDGPKPIEEQITALAEILGLDTANALECATNLPELPIGAEGWFAIPSNAGLKKLFPQIENNFERYCAGVRLVHEKIAASREFYNYYDREITPNRLRVAVRTKHALNEIARNQPGDIFIVAGQLGMRHRGRSVRRARECFDPNEFGLGSLAVGSIVLTHPNRLVRWAEQDMDCSGDEFDDPRAADRFASAPVFIVFTSGKVGFDVRRHSNAYERCGSVSAFVQQF